MRAKARYQLGLAASQNIERWRKAEGALEDIQHEFKEYGQHPEEPRWQTLKDNVEKLQTELVEERRAAGEPFPELVVERSVRGLEEARSRGNGCLCRGSSVAWTVGGHWAASGNAAGAAQWFSKAIWVAGQVSGVSDELRSDLHFCRAGAERTGGNWEQVEADCSEVCGAEQPEPEGAVQKSGGPLPSQLDGSVPGELQRPGYFDPHPSIDR